MIFDFYGNFPEIYPLNLGSLLNPDREKIGYYWDFEDYLISGNSGRGLNLRGILITSEKDLSDFINLFDTGFRITTINSRIKDKDPIKVMFDDKDHLEKIRISIVEKLKEEFRESVENKNSFIEYLRKELKYKKIWISLNETWTFVIESDNKSFWGSDIKIVRLPDFFSVMNMKELWIEIDKIGPSIFDEDMAWRDLAFKHFDLVKYIDKEVAHRTDIWCISDINDLGLI